MTEVDCYIKCLLMENTQDSITVYRVIFAPFNFHPSTLANSFAPSWSRPYTVVFEKKIIWNIEIRTVLNSPAGNKGVRDENKTGRVFPCNAYII